MAAESVEISTLSETVRVIDSLVAEDIHESGLVSFKERKTLGPSTRKRRVITPSESPVREGRIRGCPNQIHASAPNQD
jgi:hypothetical protein